MRSLLLALSTAALLLILPAAASAVLPSDLDTTFGTAGVVKTSSKVSGSDIAHTMDSSGRTLIAYESDAAVPTIRRFTTEGQPDTSFGAGGTVDLPAISGVTQPYPDQIEISTDGTIYVVGDGRIAGTERVVIWALNPTGSLQASFSPAGTPAGTLALPTVGDADNRLADAAIAPSGDLVTITDAEIVGIGYISIRSVHADGSAGYVTAKSLPGYNVFSGGLGIASNGTMVVSGGVLTPYGMAGVLFGLGADGLTDPLFMPSNSGMASIGPPFGFSASVQRLFYSGDHIVAIGHGGLVDLVARYATTGEPDASFGPYGIFRTTAMGAAFSLLQDGAPAAGGRIVATGAAGGLPGSNRAHILRVNPDGQADNTWAPGGAAGLPEANPTSALVSVQPSGKYVVTVVNDDYSIDFVRVWGDHPVPQPATAAFSSSIKSKSKAKKFKRIAGTAAGTGVTRVEVAVQLLDSKLLKKSKRCLYLSSTKPTFKKYKPVAGKCQPAKWLLASGSSSWSLKTKRALAPGKYLLSVRATGFLGVGAVTTKSITLTK